ncbi:MAG: hypothetical protein HY925_11450 [Elusimicrobia bacterium]|nr:hypothetical protein [Elusimicrobiota bacterium]
MYIAIRRYKTDPKLVPQALKRIEEDFMPVLKMAPGFVAYYALQEGPDRIATIGVFVDKEAAEKSVASAANLVKMSLSALLPNPPEIFVGPVACEARA